MQEENSSGQGKNAVVPQEVIRWNWGAFLLNWIWGIKNNTYFALLTLVPYVGFAIPIVLGLNGNKWAWQNKKWESIEQFQLVQRKWAKWGCIVISLFLLGALSIMFLVFQSIGTSIPCQMAQSQIEANQKAVEMLGKPITFGWYVPGSIHVNGSEGDATLEISVKGTLNKGKIFLKATKSMDQWKFEKLALTVENQPGSLDLLQQ